ncbi:16S rRNA (cytidine(1402)-2'-O)-methyltransferase [Floccifex sp.]|uniref:16S rRNA (cytidine(1402)-2'-O)-methyltransferase n=1 Tax=Floccifex sp. TaxID=2815810 RepID=UPI003F018F5E
MKRQKSFETQQACLYLVPTPIGNLSEMTKRCLETLEMVDIIACEDTRNTNKLLMAYNIKKPLLSHHEHNQKESIPKIISFLQEGKNVAIVSDAGYPLLSDPGQNLVKEVIAQDIPVISMSGANAAMNALVASGLSTQHYLFFGFLDSKSSKRKKELEELKEFPYTLIFYEAPHRIENCLEDILEVFGNRNICLARELTKLHEEYIRGCIQEVLSICSSLKGEMVLVIEGYTKEESIDFNVAFQKVDAYIESGLKTKQAIQCVAKEMHIKKNELYDLYHKKVVK